MEGDSPNVSRSSTFMSIPDEPTEEQNVDTTFRTDPSSVGAENEPFAGSIPLQSNVFYNHETLKYMRIIDQYKKLNVGEIELPRVSVFLKEVWLPTNPVQLVIAGSQSCGKSSLLENLTGLPVPITTGIGTRFPIEINLIEDKEFKITSSIYSSGILNDTLTPANRENMSRFFNAPMTQVQFEDLLRDVRYYPFQR